MAFVDTYGFAEVVSSVPGAAMVDTGKSLAGFVALFPPGRKWPRTADIGPNLVGLAHGLSLEGERILARANALLEARDPRRAYSLLAEWEELHALPDCVGASTDPVDRRQVAYARETERGDMSPDNLIRIAAALGYVISIAFGMWNVWEIGPDCEIGETGCEVGEPWDELLIYVKAGANNPALECAINRMIPVNMLATYIYE